jgi:hypothetical protein
MAAKRYSCNQLDGVAHPLFYEPRVETHDGLTLAKSLPRCARAPIPHNVQRLIYFATGVFGASRILIYPSLGRHSENGEGRSGAGSGGSISTVNEDE